MTCDKDINCDEVITFKKRNLTPADVSSWIITNV